MARKQGFDLFVAGKTGSYKSINRHLVLNMFELPAYLM
jgi:hypothetical protein